MTVFMKKLNMSCRFSVSVVLFGDYSVVVNVYPQRKETDEDI